MKCKKRLDHRVQEQFPHYSRHYIQSLIMQGKILVDGKPVNKPGTMISEDLAITSIAHEPKYVSRAGYKLEKALDHFALDVTGFTCLDAGLSTGGFTDCLLQRGVAKVYGVDVGYGQVHEKIRSNPNVVIMEHTNLRTLDSVGELVDLITLDLAFISILKVMDAVCALLKPQGNLITLIKPQFEARKEDVGTGGIVKNPRVHEEVIKHVVTGITERGFKLIGVIESPITGTDGNKEFLAYFVRK